MSDAQPLQLATPAGLLEAARWGPAGAPTLVLLHEGLGSVSAWRDFPARLAAATGWSVLAHSRAGYGRSPPCPLPRPLDYMTREARDVLPDVLAGAGMTGHVLVGHSDGASIAALHVGLAPMPGLRGLVLMAPHFFVEDRTLAAIRAARAAYAQGDLKTRLARHHDRPDVAFHGWADAWLDPGFRDWDISACLDTCRVPLLALQGLADPYGTRAQVDVIAARLPGAQCHLLPETGHAPHRECPDETLEVIATFLARLD